MSDTSRPGCQIVPWCALDPHPPSEPCSLIRPTSDQLDPAAVDRFVAGVAAAVKKAGISMNIALAQQPAVGGTMQDTDVARSIEAQSKARDNTDAYEAIAHELVDLIARYRRLTTAQVQSPIDGEPDSPAQLRSSIVKLDMTDHLCRLERFQVAAMGYAGAWSLLADEWNAALHEDLAGEAKHGPDTVAAEAARKCRVCGCTDDEACVNGCAWVPGQPDLCTECVGEPVDERPHLTVPADRITDVVVGSGE